METQNIFLSSNMKFLRKRRKMTQEWLASELEMSREKLKAIESGKTVNPSMVDLVRISRYFKISTFQLLTIDLNRIGELKVRELEHRNSVEFQTKPIPDFNQ